MSFFFALNIARSSWHATKRSYN